MEKEVGKVIHWYDKIGVAVVKLSGSLRVGDKVKVISGGNEFEDSIASMQVEYKDVQSGESGNEVAVKLSGKAKEGAMLYLTE